MSVERKGLLAGLLAYTLWGVFPLYWRAMSPATPLELLAHRVLWALVTVGLLMLILRRWREVAAVVRQPREFAILAVAAVPLAINWGAFIWGVNNGHVVEVSLGYFINPLVSVALGLWFFHERMRRAQWVAVAIAAVAVVVLTIEVGRPPWLGLLLAGTFGVYGLLKKASPTAPLTGLLLEALVLLPPAAGLLIYLLVKGQSNFGAHGAGHTLMMVAMGAVTAVPLVLFAVSAQSIPLSTLGLVQYVNPMIQLTLGVAVFHEPMSPLRWTGFAIVWLALAIFSADALRHAHRERKRRRSVTPVAVVAS